MTPAQLRDIQAPLKDQYRTEPLSAQTTITARGSVDFSTISCPIEGRATQPSIPGLHPMAGGDESFACAAELLLQALVGCAGVTLAAVCTAMEIPVASTTVTAEGDLDFRGTLGIDRTTPVGFTEIRLIFEFNSVAPDEKLAKAVQLAERYCVVAQTLKQVIPSWKRIE